MWNWHRFLGSKFRKNCHKLLGNKRIKYFESYLRILRLLQAFFLGLVDWLNYTCSLFGSYIKMWQVRPWHTAPHAPLFCSLHILTSTLIYSTTQNLFIKWNNHFFYNFFTVFFCSWTHGWAMKTGSHFWVSHKKQEMLGGTKAL